MPSIGNLQTQCGPTYFYEIGGLNLASKSSFSGLSYVTKLQGRSLALEIVVFKSMISRSMSTFSCPFLVGIQESN